MFPVIATLVALGLGLLVDWAAGDRLPGPLLLPVGLGALIGVTQLTTWSHGLAPATPAIVAVLGGAGLVLRHRRLLAARLDLVAAAAGLGVFLAYLVPVIASGHPAFTGYVLLGDTSIHLELADRMVHAGATTAGLPPSGATVSMLSYFSSSYPTGSHTVLGGLGGLVPTDLAWLYHPYLAWIVGIAALALYELLRPVVTARWLRGWLAFLAAQPALVYGFAMQGAIKELATIALLATLFALLPWVLARATAWRATLPLAVVAAGALGAIDVAAGVWLAPALAALLVAALWRARPRALLAPVASFAVAGAVLAAPTLAGLGSFVTNAQGVLTTQTEMGDLAAPLDWIQGFGVWPKGDFRLPLDHPQLYVLIGLAIAGVALGAAYLWRTRALAVLGFAVVSGFGCWWVTRTGSPWADAKAYAILAPALLLLALVGAASLAFLGRRLEGGLLLAVLSATVLWTNALAYHDVQLSAWPRLHELQRIGERYASDGPAFTPEFEEFAKYFLRRMAPVSGPEPWKPAPAGVVPGQALRFGFSSEIGQYTAGYLEGFRTLVVRRAPVQSRPPSDFRLVEQGRFYDVWQHDPRAPRIVSELPLGDARLQRGAVPACGRVRAFAAANAGARLLWAPAPPLAVGVPTKGPHSGNLTPDGADPFVLRAVGPGFAAMRVRVPRAGLYGVWIEASLARPLHVLVDGRPVGTAPAALSPRGVGEDVFVGRVSLPAGPATIRLVRPGGGLSPGNGSGATIIGPVTLAPAGPESAPVHALPAARWRSLCGRRLDWVESVR